MGWYIVRKKIKGKVYLYRQRTYREGGKVRTQSQYIGPQTDSGEETSQFNQGRVDAIEAALAEARRKRDAERVRELEPVVNIEPKDCAVDPVNTTASEDDRTSLVIEADLECHGISRQGVEGEHRRLLKQMEVNGLDPGGLPQVLIGGGVLTALDNLVNGGFRVTVPSRKKKGRNEQIRFRKCYRKALALSYLKSIEHQRPDVFERLRCVHSQSHWAAKWALIKIILASQTQRSKWKGRGKKRHRVTTGTPRWALTLHVLVSGQVPDFIRKQMGPEALGMMDFDRSGTWRDEAADLMTEIMKRGYGKTLKRYRAQAVVLDRTIAKAVRDYQGMGLRARLKGDRAKQRLRIKRLLARKQAFDANTRKVKAMRSMMSEWR